jgi:hypothetical protein
MSTPLGLSAKIYYGVNATQGALPTTWTELTNVADVTLDMSKGEADVTTRANDGWRAIVGTLKEGSVDIKMMFDPTDTGFTAVQNAFFTGTDIGFLIMSGDKGAAAGASQGLKALFQVVGWTKGEPLEEAQTINAKIKITRCATAPAWVASPVT